MGAAPTANRGLWTTDDKLPPGRAIVWERVLNSEAIFLLLFMVATAVAIAARWLRLPYTVALVLAGLLLGTVQLFPAPQLTKTLLFSIFLPGLIFEAAFHIDFREFSRNRTTILSLAVPGVVASIALTVIILTPVINALAFVHGLGWRHTLVFGALIAATDPIAVIAIFRSLGVPRRLEMLLDGESLLNDGTGIVFFTLSLSLFTGTVVSVGGLALEFVTVVGMGAAIGAAMGLLASALIRRVDDPMIEITLTTMAAYGSFVAADQLGYSGVIATVAAGMLCGNYGAATGMSPSTRVAAETFWEYVAFALNSFVFLLIGLEVRLESLLASWLAIVVAYLVITLSRAAVITLAWAALGLTRERFPGRWAVVLTWGGLRGALPMVLVLGLPQDFPYRDLLISMTFGVVILSILIHGLTMSPLLGRLGIVRQAADREGLDLWRAQLLAADAALKEIDHMAALQTAEPEVLESLRAYYRESVERAKHGLNTLDVNREQVREEELYRTRHQLLMVEKKTLIEARQQGRLSHAVYDRLLADIDARLLRLESGAPLG